MKNLISKATANLPDWLNPVYVKELRQTLHSKSFWIISGVIVLTEFLFWYVAYEQITDVRENVSVFYRTESDWATVMLYGLLSYVWLLGTVALLQPAISRWTEERQLDAVSPERTTDLSVWAILRGKLMLHLTLLLWVVLLCLPLFFWLYPKVENDHLLQGYLCVASLSLLLILNLNVWSTIVSMNMRIRRNVTGGLGLFGWAVLSIGTLLILLYQSVLIAFLEENHTQATEFYMIALYMVVVPLIYGIFLLVSVMKPERSNRMFPARVSGYVLCGLTALCCWCARSRIADETLEDVILLFSFLLVTGYVAFQSVLVVFEPLFMPKRMQLDAPRNIFGRMIWYVNGTGTVCAWCHLMIPFAVVSVLFAAEVWDREMTAFLALMLVFVSYLIIYSVIVSLVRVCLPKFPGGIVLVAVCAVGWILDMLLIVFNLKEIAYISPLSYCVQRLTNLLQMKHSGIENDIISFAAQPILIVAWCGIVLVLVSAIIAEVRRFRQQTAE